MPRASTLPGKFKTITGLKRELDRRFSIKVRQRGYCQAAIFDRVRCGGGLQCAHIIGRKNLTLQWDTLNALSLCQGHHVWFTHNPVDWMEFIKKQFPANFAHVMSERNEPFDRDYEALLQWLSA